MSQMEFAQPQRRKEAQEAQEMPLIAVNKQEFNVDALLDDIDTLLETNATSFVQGFVQKGGE
ncbi:MAG: ubiquitin-like protein Pup [Arcanobacterium sp.]|nr:ubiquitin-like protein Pup [Arcanobacterium sp.]